MPDGVYPMPAMNLTSLDITRDHINRGRLLSQIVEHGGSAGFNAQRSDEEMQIEEKQEPGAALNTSSGPPHGPRVKMGAPSTFHQGSSERARAPSPLRSLARQTSSDASDLSASI